VEVEGELCYINKEVDGDLHMELAELGEGCPMDINPFRQLIVEATPWFKSKHSAWSDLLDRGQSRWLDSDHHPEALIPSSPNSIRRREKGLPIRVAGLLMRDTHSEGARSGWEIHPVMRIECEDASGSWVEFSRPTDCVHWQP